MAEKILNDIRKPPRHISVLTNPKNSLYNNSPSKAGSSK